MKAAWQPAGLNEDLNMSTLRSKNVFATLGNIADVFGSAAAVASAVEAGRQPKARHLQTLGIDQDAFRSIGKR
ncbi:MAG: hypothetical protein JWR39_72 [Devosia sp.]|jgi:hypothetical protein|nr:hypothetical protein [Devosia sp.]